MRGGGRDDRLLVDVLGPVRARHPDGRDLTPEGPLQRRLLSFLVLRRGHVVSVDAAIDVLWPVKAPRDPVAALHNQVFRLRRSLPDGVIESTGSGYRVDPARIDVDADRLAAALSETEPGDPSILPAIEALLERWHGPAYPELDDVDDGRAEQVRLDELRVHAIERRAECRLAVGDTEGLVAELSALAEDEPLRERPRALLMTALAKAGRVAEALRVYDDFRRRLATELGIEPSPSLAAQHAELLAGEPAGGWAPITRLPVPVTSLVGRDALVEEVTALAAAHRLVTLLGPGGVGKTRMLGQVGHELLGRDGGPVVMCELAAATEESAVDAVAAALSIEGRPGVGLAERIATVLGDTKVVLLLDNCEHVLDPVAGLVELLLARCPNVSFVTTSRERLRLPAEQLCPVPPLPCAGDRAPAVELFVERARAVAPGFDPDPAERALVAEIVGRLDGLPLAIELAAARLHTLDLTDVATGLDRRFDLLAPGFRTSDRHRSLHTTISWSYELLAASLQQTFADLSVFAGPFTADDAAAVCGTDRATVTAALDQLVERSLVTRLPGRRYELLETLRAFGAEQLVAGGRADVAGERHARHQIDWLEAARRRMPTPDGANVLVAIDAALPELRAALAWLLDHDRTDDAGRLVAALFEYGFLRLRPDVLAWSERVLAADSENLSPHAPVAWAVSGYAVWFAGDVAEAGARGARARKLAEAAGGQVPPPVATLVGSHHLFEGQLANAAGWYRVAADAAGDDRAVRLQAASSELLALAYAGDPSTTSAVEQVLAEVGDDANPCAAYAWYCAGEADLFADPDRARRRFDRALELAELTGASFVAGVAGASKASLDARLGDPEVAAADYRRLLTHWRRAGVWSTQWTMLRSIAGLLARLGRAEDAARLLGAVRATQAGHRIFGADEAALTELGARLRAELGDGGYERALSEGADLDGDASVELALRAL